MSSIYFKWLSFSTWFANILKCTFEDFRFHSQIKLISDNIQTVISKRSISYCNVTTFISTTPSIIRRNCDLIATLIWGQPCISIDFRIIYHFGWYFLIKWNKCFLFSRNRTFLVQFVKIVSNLTCCIFIIYITISSSVITTKVSTCTFEFKQFTILLVYSNLKCRFIQNIIIQSRSRSCIFEFNCCSMRNSSNFSRIKCSFDYKFSNISYTCRHISYGFSVFVQTYQFQSNTTFIFQILHSVNFNFTISISDFRIYTSCYICFDYIYWRTNNFRSSCYFFAIYDPSHIFNLCFFSCILECQIQLSFFFISSSSKIGNSNSQFAFLISNNCFIFLAKCSLNFLSIGFDNWISIIYYIIQLITNQFIQIMSNFEIYILIYIYKCLFFFFSCNFHIISGDDFIPPRIFRCKCISDIFIQIIRIYTFSKFKSQVIDTFICCIFSTS